MKYLFVGESEFSDAWFPVLKEMIPIKWVTLDKIKDVDIVFALGNRKIIPKEILDIPRVGFIGSHPTLLPRGRGCSPLVWTIIKKIKNSGLTFFWLDEWIDTGDIWCQDTFTVPKTLPALHRKVIRVGSMLLKKYVPELERGEYIRIKQTGKGTYWRQRIKGKDRWI